MTSLVFLAAVSTVACEGRDAPLSAAPEDDGGGGEPTREDGGRGESTGELVMFRECTFRCGAEVPVADFTCLDSPQRRGTTLAEASTWPKAIPMFVPSTSIWLRTWVNGSRCGA